MKAHLLAAMLVAAASPVTDVMAQQDTAALFGARETIGDISLSPDGGKVAFISPIAGQGSALFVADVTGATPPLRITNADGDPERLSWCGWVSNDRLVCSIYMVIDTAGVLGSFQRLVAIDADGKNLKMVSPRTDARALGFDQSGGAVLDWLADDTGAILMTRNYIPEYSTGTHLANHVEGLGVDRVDTLSLKTRKIEAPKRTAIDYISDGHGAIRILGTQGEDSSGYSGTSIRYLYRTKDSDAWKPLSKTDLTARGAFEPYAVDRDLDVAYGFADKDGRQALYSLSLDGALNQQLVFAHPRVDVSGLIRIGRRHRVVGVSYATDKRQVEFFDPQLKALGKSLSRALPGLPLVTFVDSSLDESKLLLWAGSDVDPGRYYLYDKRAKTLNEVLLARPALEKVPLAAVKPISYKAADGALVPGYLTLPPGSAGKKLPAIVMPHGGPSSRDEWGFDWLAQFFAARGYAVFQPNFRGSAGYGDGWYQKNGFQSWRTAIGDVNDGARWLVSEGIADPARMAIMGWSYGGYAALQSAVVEPDLFKAVIAVAPVTDLAGLKNNARRYTNFRSVDDFIGSGSHLKEGSPAQNAARIKPPVLLFHGDRDLNVDIGQSRLMDDRLRAAGKRTRLVVYPGLDHQLEDSSARTDLLRQSDAFLRTEMGL